MTIDWKTQQTPEIQAAYVLLARLGITPEQLLQDLPTPRPMPTFADYIDQVSQAVTAGTRRVYETYWRRIRIEWGNRRIDEPTPLEIKQLATKMQGRVVGRRNARGGRTATEHLIAALRCLYRYAVADGLIEAERNPANKVAKPRRLTSNRRAIPDDFLAKINTIAATTGNDGSSKLSGVRG